MERRLDEATNFLDAARAQADNRFDASQYAFFGKGLAQDVELGGLDDEDEELGHLHDFDDDDELSSSAARDEAGGFSELGDVGDLTTSFLKLNTIHSEDGTPPYNSYVGKEEHDLPADISWTEDIEIERQKWRASQEVRVSESAPQRHQQQQQQQQQQEWWSNAPHHPPFSAPKPHNRPQSPQMLHAMMHHGPPGAWLSPRPLLQDAHVHLRPPQVVLQQPPQRSFPFPVMPHVMQASLEAELRGKPPPQKLSPESFRKSLEGGGASQMRSKYMTNEEIETIARIQWAATHGSDPYIDDYYHQAMQAKLAGGTPYGRRHFAPSHLRELPSHARTAAEPHAFLQVDALGRIPFSSIRRPRPLLDVDGVNDKPEQAESLRRLEQEPMLAARIAVEDGLCLLLDVDDIDRLLSTSPLPDGGIQLRRRRQMLLEGLAASLQLVDPLHQKPQQQQLGESNGKVSGRDDLVFLRLVSLPKGRKLVSRYLRLLTPGTELVRVVLMAIFRHLRFLFGGVNSEPASSLGLVVSVVSTIKNLDLASVSACLAAVVLAAEPPPLRPIGSTSGDGATMLLQAVLEQATAILSSPRFQQEFGGGHHHSSELWQASFDAFFGLLAKSCSNKYESIMHSLSMASSSAPAAAISSAAANAMAREMPMELLKASLPHTNEQQRQRLLEFAQRSIVQSPSTSGYEARMCKVEI